MCKKWSFHSFGLDPVSQNPPQCARVVFSAHWHGLGDEPCSVVVVGIGLKERFFGLWLPHWRVAPCSKRLVRMRLAFVSSARRCCNLSALGRCGAPGGRTTRGSFSLGNYFEVFFWACLESEFWHFRRSGSAPLIIMIVPHGMRYVVDRWLSIVQLALSILAPILVAALRMEIEGLPLFFQLLVGPVRDKPWILLLVTGLIPCLQSARQLLGKAWHWKMIQYVLDEMRKDVFNGVDGANAFSERVTLFKHKSFSCGLHAHWWGGWMIAVARSDHVQRKKCSKFRAPDHGDHAEGIAGRAWVSKKVCGVDQLPVLNAKSLAREVSHYAQQGYVSPKWLRKQIKKNKPLPRCIYGFPVEVDGRPWGVIVIDSRLPELPKLRDSSTAAVYESFERHAGVLSKLLKEV